MNHFWKDYPNIQQPLADTCLFIEQVLKVRNKHIEQVFIDLTHSGGKLLRPAFFFLFTQLDTSSQQNKKQLTQIAASIELLHMASLIHDDIIDDSPLRRGSVTIQARYGKDVAVYSGDLLFTLFFELLTESMSDSPFLKINASAMKRLVLGEMNQMNLRYKKEISVLDYLRNINGKTAELFALSCLQGAYFGQASAKTQKLACRIGRRIGLSFQILDDILDYSSETVVLKKPVLEDLAQGVYTLPLILAMKEAPNDFQYYLDKQAAITLAETEEVAKLVQRYQGVQQAQTFAEALIQKALLDIQQLPDTVAKEQLHRLATQLLLRSD